MTAGDRILRVTGFIMRERLKGAIDAYNEAAGADPGIRKFVEGKRRMVEIRLEEGRAYHFLIEEVVAHPLRDGPAEEKPDILVKSTSEVFEEIFAGTLSPVKAMATGKLVLKASIMDLLLLKRYFDGAIFEQTPSTPSSPTSTG